MTSRVALAVVVLLAYGVSTYAQDAPKKPKPAPQPFKWVNDPPKSGLPSGVTHATFHSDANHCDVGYCIYLPPQYEQQPDTRFPVVYWLHGGRPGSEMKTVAMAPYFDKYIRSGEVPPMIYVMPNGGKLSHYDHEDSLGETAFLEIVKHVDKTYRTIADRCGRAIEGYSQGGRGTARYMFKHPELFCSAAPMDGGHGHEKDIADHNGAESDTLTINPPTNNTWDLAKEYAAKPHPPMPILVVTGDQSFNYEANLAWSQHLKSLGIDHELIVVPGIGHSSKLTYDKLGPRVMQFHAANFAKAAEAAAAK
ncbi:MAG: prolyl oligopeptidase family serine peptidase [Phycisphaera sp.]|nr:prolyl oligopeptidase family serine peptidase [Phycisphaera sp.]